MIKDTIQPLFTAIVLAADREADNPVTAAAGVHALPIPRIIDHFCAEAMASGCDVVAALALRQAVTDAYPETRRTAYHLGGTDYCSCNLFAFLTPQARAAAHFWRRGEHQRKKPLRVIRLNKL